MSLLCAAAGVGCAAISLGVDRKGMIGYDMHEDARRREV